MATREEYNAYQRKWKEAKRRQEGIMPRKPGVLTPENMAEYKRQWYRKNPSKGPSYTKKWRAENLAKAQEYQRRYNEEHREEKRIKKHLSDRAKGVKPKNKKKSRTEESRIYRQRHPEKVRAAENKRRSQNRESFNVRGAANAARRRVRKAGIPGAHTLQEWLHLCAKFDHRCVRCGSHASQKPLTRDHVIPITKPNSTDDISNIQPLCKPCNCGKGNRGTVDYRRTPFQGRGQSVMFA